VEQRGIKNYFVKEFNSKNPIITIKANEDYAPNVVISVVLIRGRVASPPPTFMVDLAKPSIKMGLTEVNVDKKKYRLDVEIKTDKDKYHVREKVYGKVIVRGADSDADVMLIVVDEGLLSLMENPTYNILDGIVKKVPYEVKSSSGLIQVVGKRHFGKKAMPSGGGGGRLVTREMFDTLIYFNPSIKTRNGVAEFIFDLNDCGANFFITLYPFDSQNFKPFSFFLLQIRQIFETLYLHLKHCSIVLSVSDPNDFLLCLSLITKALIHTQPLCWNIMPNSSPIISLLSE
jgi:hypothetical protein